MTQKHTNPDAPIHLKFGFLFEEQAEGCGRLSWLMVATEAGRVGDPLHPHLINTPVDGSVSSVPLNTALHARC
jgi:hypothetical protein